MIASLWLGLLLVRLGKTDPQHQMPSTVTLSSVRSDGLLPRPDDPLYRPPGQPDRQQGPGLGLQQAGAPRHLPQADGRPHLYKHFHRYHYYIIWNGLV